MDTARSAGPDRRAGALTALLVAGALCLSSGVAAQSGVPLSREISISAAEASLSLEFEVGAPLSVTFRDGTIEIGGEAVGSYAPGAALDRAWRALLGEATATADSSLGSLLTEWTPPAGLADAAAEIANRLDAALAAPFAGLGSGAGAADVSQAVDAAVSAAVEAREAALAEERQNAEALERRIQRLESQLRRERAESRSGGWGRSIAQGFQGLLATFLTFLLLSGGGWLAVRSLPSRFEATATALRTRPAASLGAGVAGAFLTLPAFVIGIVALALSIVGVLAIPFWIVGFPVLIFGAAVFGYLVFARVLGEWVSDRTNGDMARVGPGSPFAYLVAGVVVLLSLSAAAAVVSIFGPWFDWLQALLLGFGGVLTFLGVLLGFGAVILTRGGRWGYAGAATTEPDWSEVDLAWDEGPEPPVQDYDSSEPSGSGSGHGVGDDSATDEDSGGGEHPIDGEADPKSPGF